MKSAAPDSPALASAAAAAPDKRRSPWLLYCAGTSWLILASKVAVTMREIPQIALTLMVLAAALFLYAFLRARSRLAQGIGLLFLLGTALLVYDYGLHLPSPTLGLPLTRPSPPP